MSEPDEKPETKEAAPQEGEETVGITETPSVEEAPTKPEKTKEKDEGGAYRYYKIEDGKLTRLRPFCERCGPGYFMANHGDRHTCGNCGFTRYIQKKP